MKQYKKWILIFITVFAAAAATVVALVIYVDPFFQYHKPIDDFPYVVDNQINQNPGMARHMDYDSVILGSSMTVNFNTNWFEELMGLKALKLSYSGAFPKDQANIMDIIFDSGNEVDAVFLGIDVITYSAGVEETKYPIPEYLYDSCVWNDIDYVLNKDVLLQYILRPLADPDKTDLATVYASWWTEEYYNKQWVMHNYVQPEKVEEEADPENYVRNVKVNLDANICPYIEANPDTEFYIFYPPYSILFWNDVLRENHMEATMKEYEYMTERLLAYDNVRVFFFPNQEWIICDLDNYADYSHYHPDINRYMTECFVSGECEVTEENLTGELSKMRDIVAAYDFEELFSVEY
ncbi:MAG: hypothetical protein GX235_11340 [Clostridiales bacterium]|nr:hypothetical protein [Clostridiales bacterium]